MSKPSQPGNMADFLAMPFATTNDFVRTIARIAPRRLPVAPFALQDVPVAAPKPKKSDVERAQPSKAALLAAARQRGLRGATLMSREALAKALSH